MLTSDSAATDPDEVGLTMHSKNTTRTKPKKKMVVAALLDDGSLTRCIHIGAAYQRESEWPHGLVKKSELD
jgi:hypothetical protein